MKNINFAFLILILVASVFASCTKKSQENVNPNNGYSIGGGSSSNPALAFFNTNLAPSQNFTINISNGNATIVGSSGTKITIPKKSLILNGQAYTGNIKVELKEIYNQLNMILSNRTTVTTDGKLLISGGEIFINTTSADGRQLQIKDSSFFLIKMPVDSAVQSGMTYFTGIPDTSGTFNWVRMNADTATSFPVDTLAFDSTWAKKTSPVFYFTPTDYIFTINRLGWTNCDKYWDIPNKVNIGVTCNSPCTIANTKVFVTFKDTKTSAGCYHNGTAFMANGIPQGYMATIIAIGYRDGQEFFSIKDTSALTDIGITLTLKPMSQDSIKTVLTQKLN